MLNIYVSSTIRQEGKTFLSAGLAATMQSLGYKTCVYKPIQTSGIEINGFTQSPDLTFVKAVDPYVETEYTYIYKSQEEPLIAAENENDYIDIELINKDFKKIGSVYDCIVVDGEAGILSPIAPVTQTSDIIKKIQTPTLFIVEPDRDAINRALTSINSTQEKGLSIRGVVINKITEDVPKELLTSMTRVIEEYSGVNIVGLLPYLKGKIAPEELISTILNGIDVESVFGVKIEKLDF